MQTPPSPLPHVESPRPEPRRRLHVVFLRRRRQFFPQERSHLPLDLDDRVCLEQLVLELVVLALEPRVLVRQRVVLRLAASLLGRQAGELALVALTPPRGQVRRVQALAAQHLANPTLLARRERLVGLLEDAELVLGNKAPALRTFGGGGSLRIPRTGSFPDCGRRSLPGRGGAVLLGHVRQRDHVPARPRLSFRPGEPSQSRWHRGMRTLKKLSGASTVRGTSVQLLGSSLQNRLIWPR